VEVRACTNDQKHESKKGNKVMKSKRPELTAGLVAVKGAAAPAPDMPTRAGASMVASATRPRPEGEGREEIVPLNFRVASSFRREFKTYAASHDLKLNKLLQECFAAYRREKGD
jgi:hypothetical protein